MKFNTGGMERNDVCSTMLLFRDSKVFPLAGSVHQSFGTLCATGPPMTVVNCYRPAARYVDSRVHIVDCVADDMPIYASGHHNAGARPRGIGVVAFLVTHVYAVNDVADKVAVLAETQPAVAAGRYAEFVVKDMVVQKPYPFWGVLEPHARTVG